VGAWDYKRYGSADDPVRQSDLATLAHCPQLLLRRREASLAAPAAERRVHGIRVSGTAAHGTLKRALPYAVEGKPVNLTHVRAAFFDELDKACAAEGTTREHLHWRRGTKPDEHYRVKIAALTHFLMLAPERIASVECVETEFRSVIKHGSRAIHTLGTWDIVCRTKEGKLALVDYKTGIRRMSVFARTTGYQLGMYAQGMLEGVAADGRRFGAWPDEIWVLMTQDFLPQRKDSSRKVWEPEEAEHFRCRRGETVRIRKGQQKGPGWYRAERTAAELPALAAGIWSMVATVRAGQFYRVWNDDACPRCEVRVPCVQSAYGVTDMSASEKRRLEAALADIPLDELDVGFGDGEP
jgi:RecB family exonuclease